MQVECDFSFYLISTVLAMTFSTIIASLNDCKSVFYKWETMSLQLNPNQRSNLLFGLWIFVLLVLVYYILLKVYLYLALIVISYFSYRYILQTDKSHIGPEGRGVLITGCDTGFGHAFALRLEKLGFIVFAGCLLPDGDGAKKLQKAGSKRLHVLHLDVTKDEHVQKAVEFVSAKLSSKAGLWAVINNAALYRCSAAELASIELMKRVADVNFYGTVRVTQAFIPMLRHTGGRVINVTSVRGRVALPFDAVYTPTKYATEAFSDILRREMESFGVKVVMIEPGNFTAATGIVNSANVECIKKDLVSSLNSASAETKKVYGKHYLDPILSGFESFGQTGCKSLEPIVDAMSDAVTSTFPKYRYLVPGGDKLFDWYAVAAVLHSYLPEVLMDYLVRVFDPPPSVEYKVQSQ